MPDPDPLLEYATPRSADDGRWSFRYFRAAVRAHVWASYAAYLGWYGFSSLTHGISPSASSLVPVLLAPVLLPFTMMRMLIGVLTGRGAPPVYTIFFAGYVAVFALLFWWLVRRDKRKRAA